MAIAYGGISYKLWFTMKQQIREKSGKLAFTIISFPTATGNIRTRPKIHIQIIILYACDNVCQLLERRG
jgi:hypothetical protein